MYNSKTIKLKLNNSCKNIVKIKTNKIYPQKKNLNPQCDVEKNLQKKLLKK